MFSLFFWYDIIDLQNVNRSAGALADAFTTIFSFLLIVFNIQLGLIIIKER